MQAEMAGMFGISLAQTRNASGVQAARCSAVNSCAWPETQAHSSARGGCKAEASTAKTHFEMPDHPASSAWRLFRRDLQPSRMQPAGRELCDFHHNSRAQKHEYLQLVELIRGLL
jgi:hypothetical protein